MDTTAEKILYQTQLRKKRTGNIWPHLMFSNMLCVKKTILRFQVYQNNHSVSGDFLGTVEQMGEITEGRERTSYFPTLKTGKRRKIESQTELFWLHFQ